MGLEEDLELFGVLKRDTRSSAPDKEAIDGLAAPAGPCGCLYALAPAKTYEIPRMTESPAVHRGMLRRWITEFHRRNGMTLPKRFYQRDKRQLRGMFYGMLRQYGVSIEDITGRQDYR